MGLLWDDEGSISYDLQRAHSADIWFLRMRAWFWGVTASVATFLLGHMIGVLGINLYEMVWSWFGGH